MQDIHSKQTILSDKEYGMTKRVFDDIPRDSKGPGNYSGSNFKYLNRSAKESASKCRDIIEKWYSELPDTCKSDIRKRLRSSDDNQFVSTFFELYIFTLLKSMGYKVTVHPEIESETKHPDFYAENDQGEAFYFEVPVLTKSDRELSK
jgi:hypothetical protein